MQPRDFDLSDPDATAFCPSCHAGYTGRVQGCFDCGVPLLTRDRVESLVADEPGQEPPRDVETESVAVCPACGAEYTASSAQCVHCRVALVSPTQDPALESFTREAEPPALTTTGPGDTVSEEPIAAGATTLGAVREVARDSSKRDHFTAPASIWRVVAYGSVSAVVAAYGAAEALRGDTRLRTFVVAVLFGLFALEHWRRLSAGDLLPPQFRCPDCDASIRLSRAERERATFHCDACGEDFEVEDSYGRNGR